MNNIEKSGKTKMSDQIKQSIAAARLLNPLLSDSLPKEIDEKFAVFRTYAISECIVYDSITDIPTTSNE